ncbi:YkvA family protein [Gemmatimonas groenlandica]|uniref:DUF1232 domain-containing protein n=1 Tax=Gemmatimonas groenlandica TaxID=2732249 RepID=A0A6M4IKM5_9BACT|nr:YkvA family protein [Gemmatimonas groenlandica]QJR34418.1 DUF1232 domain-containing protein [Gemmatimonas groenlandica]
MTTDRLEDLPPEPARERHFDKLAREREADRRAGRPERGLFTGRGRKESAPPDDDAPRRARRRRPSEDDDESARPQTGMKRSVLRAIQQIPAYLRLLLGLVGDSRVSKFDRFLVLAAGAYMVSPIDFIPDFIPFLGEIDDLFLLMTALQRLVANAGRTVLLDHWRGDPEELEDVNLARLVSAAGFFLPVRLRRRLRKMAGR